MTRNRIGSVRDMKRERSGVWCSRCAAAQAFVALHASEWVTYAYFWWTISSDWSRTGSGGLLFWLQWWCVLDLFTSYFTSFFDLCIVIFDYYQINQNIHFANPILYNGIRVSREGKNQSEDKVVQTRNRHPVRRIAWRSTYIIRWKGKRAPALSFPLFSSTRLL